MNNLENSHASLKIQKSLFENHGLNPLYLALRKGLDM